MEEKELKIEWNGKESYYGDYVFYYGDKRASLYDLSQVYAIKEELWEPAVSMKAVKDENELWEYTVFFGRMIDPERLALYDDDPIEEREEYINGTRSYYDKDLVDKPRESLSDADIITLLGSLTYTHYMESKNTYTIEINENENFINIGGRSFPYDCIGELLGTSYPEHYSEDQYRKALYSSEWNKFYCDLETNPHLDMVDPGTRKLTGRVSA